MGREYNITNEMVGGYVNFNHHVSARVPKGMRYKDWEEKKGGSEYVPYSKKHEYYRREVKSDRPRFYQVVNGKRVRRRDLEHVGD